MTEPKKKRTRRGPGRAILRWHRRIGIGLSAVFIVICLTGILLNHNVDLDLDNKQVEADWIYKWYGIEPQGDLIHFQTSENSSVSLFSGSLYFETTQVATAQNLIGIAKLSDFMIAATDSSLLILSESGELIETLSDSSLPNGTLISISSSDTGRALLQTDEGFFLADENLLTWQPTDRTKQANTITPSPASPELKRQLIASFRGEGISWNRVILDLHSGRFFGSLGKWIVDLTAFGLIFLTFTGIWYTTRHLKKARERAMSK